MMKKSPQCNDVQLNNVQLLIQDKLQNVSQSVSQSMSAVLRQSV